MSVKDTFDVYCNAVEANRAICAKDPLTLTIADVEEGRRLVKALDAIDDEEAADCELAHLKNAVLRAVAKHHHRSADLARVVLGER